MCCHKPPFSYRTLSVHGHSSCYLERRVKFTNHVSVHVSQSVNINGLSTNGYEQGSRTKIVVNFFPALCGLWTWTRRLRRTSQRWILWCLHWWPNGHVSDESLHNPLSGNVKSEGVLPRWPIRQWSEGMLPRWPIRQWSEVRRGAPGLRIILSRWIHFATEGVQCGFSSLSGRHVWFVINLWLLSTIGILPT